MKYTGVIIFIFLAVGCAEHEKRNVAFGEQELKEKAQRMAFKLAVDTIPKKKEMTLSYIDSNGLKQGRWERLGQGGRLTEVSHYLNDTLHGYWMKQHHGMKQDAYYDHGKKEGFERYFYNEGLDADVLTLGYYENGEVLWYAHPGADQGGLVPIKGVDAYVDSIYVKVPFMNKSLWYEGLFIKKEPKGIHKVYYPEGMVQGMVDYETDTYLEYDSLGRVIRQDSLRYYDNKRRFGRALG